STMVRSCGALVVAKQRIHVGIVGSTGRPATPAPRPRHDYRSRSLNGVPGSTPDSETEDHLCVTRQTPVATFTTRQNRDADRIDRRYRNGRRWRGAPTVIL